jgi:hypothetical protein
LKGESWSPPAAHRIAPRSRSGPASPCERARAPSFGTLIMPGLACADGDAARACVGTRVAVPAAGPGRSARLHHLLRRQIFSNCRRLPGRKVLACLSNGTLSSLSFQTNSTRREARRNVKGEAASFLYSGGHIIGQLPPDRARGYPSLRHIHPANEQ